MKIDSLKIAKNPMPVLFVGNDIYKSGCFEAKISVENQPRAVIVKVEFKLENQSIEKLICEKKAAFLCHIECSKTKFRQAIKSFENRIEIILNSDDLSDILDFSIFVVAICDFSYSSELFNDYYADMSFEIEEGMILAAQETKREKISKTPSTNESIFGIIAHEREFCSVDFNGGEKILIFIPRESLRDFKEQRENNHSRPELNGLILLNPLAEAIRLLKEAYKNGNSYEYENCEWAKSLTQQIKIKFNIDLETDEIDSYYELAQKVLDNPLPKALKNMRKETDDEDI